MHSLKRNLTAVLLPGILLAADVGFAQQQPAAEPQLDLTPREGTYRERPGLPGHPDSGDAGTTFSFDFNQLDANSNDVITPEEAEADPLLTEVFDQVDRNNDLKISPSEFSAFETLRMERSRGRSQESPSGEPPAPDAAPPPR